MFRAEERHWQPSLAVRFSRQMEAHSANGVGRPVADDGYLDFQVKEPSFRGVIVTLHHSINSTVLARKDPGAHLC